MSFHTGQNTSLSNFTGAPIPNAPTIDPSLLRVDPGAFSRRTQAKIDSITRQLDIDAESVAASFNARGLTRAGGREEAILQTVSSGIPAIAGAIAEGEIGLQQLQISAQLQALGISTQQYMAILQLIQGQTAANAQQNAALFGSLGAVAGVAATAIPGVG